MCGHPSQARSSQRGGRVACQNSCLGFGGREALQAAPSVVCPGALPCLGEQFRFGEAVPAGAGPPCRPGSARTRSTATRCALQRRAQFFHGAKDPRRTRALYACPRAPLFAPGALARRACPPHLPRTHAQRPLRRPSCTPAVLPVRSWLTCSPLGVQVRFSPYKPTLLACSAAQYYGIVGNGRLYVLDCDPMSSVITPVAMCAAAPRPLLLQTTRTKQPRCRLAGSSRRTASTTWPGAR